MDPGKDGQSVHSIISQVISTTIPQGGDSGDSSQRLDQANKVRARINLFSLNTYLSKIKRGLILTFWSQRIEELEERVRVAEAQVASHWELLRRLYDVILVFDMSG